MPLITVTVSQLEPKDIFNSGGLAYRVRTAPAIVDGMTQVEVRYQNGTIHTRSWANPDTELEVRRQVEPDGADRVDGLPV